MTPFARWWEINFNFVKYFVLLISFNLCYQRLLVVYLLRSQEGNYCHLLGLTSVWQQSSQLNMFFNIQNGQPLANSLIVLVAYHTNILPNRWKNLFESLGAKVVCDKFLCFVTIFVSLYFVADNLKCSHRLISSAIWTNQSITQIGLLNFARLFHLVLTCLENESHKQCKF